MSSVTIVTPVYNAAKHLNALYDCLCSQSYTDWYWIAVNDGSTDQSGKILDDIANNDNRVRVLHQSNSGAPKMPRDRAVYEATTDFIIPVDADDTIDAHYLETMLKRQQATDADIVYPRMYFMKEGKSSFTLPKNNIDTTTVYAGRDVVLFTLPEFRIGCNGGLYRKAIWVNSSYPSFDGKTIFMNSDEVDERLYLLQADKVAFCEAQYLYAMLPDSITKAVNINRFDILDTNQQLLDIIAKEYGNDSEAYALAQRKMFAEFRCAMRLFQEHYHDFADNRTYITNKLRHTFNLLSNISLSPKERIMFLGMKSFRWLMLLTSIKYRSFSF